VSAKPERWGQNLEVFDFALTDEEPASLSALDGSGSAPADSDKSGHWPKDAVN
jgi:2,5-diketo-D-gluconate reductase A